MQRYTVIAALAFNPGEVLGLNEQQAQRRRHLVKPLGGGRYEVLTRIEFKVGEVIATASTMSKMQAAMLEPEEGTQQKVAAQAHEKAKPAKAKK